MKCTNKKQIAVILFSILLVISVTGCQSKESSLSVSYTKLYGNAVNNTASSEKAEGFSSGLCVSSQNIAAANQIDVQDASAGLFAVDQKQVLFAQNIHEKRNPASLTKVMTALLALKYGNLNDTVTVSKNAIITESGAQLCGFLPGDTLTLEQALYGLMMYSGNDAGVIIAEHIGGSLEGFADMMNEEAKSLGAMNTHFVNPHGLTDSEHYTTAYDLYLIFQEAIKYDKFMEIIGTVTYTTQYTDSNGKQKEVTFNTTNAYLKGKQKAPDGVYVLGGKTGTTAAAGSCLILLSKDAEYHPYISVILKAADHSVLYEKMTELIANITQQQS